MRGDVFAHISQASYLIEDSGGNDVCVCNYDDDDEEDEMMAMAIGCKDDAEQLPQDI